jgi:two-component SAPR family response regulator
MYKLLVVEDDAVMRSALCTALKGAGYEVENAENGLKALELAGQKTFDCIISDIRMPGLDGVSMLARFKEKSQGIKTIFITGYSDDEPIIRALNLGADGLLKKPFGMKDLLQMISLKMQAKEKEKEQEKKLSLLFEKLKESLGAEEAQKILGNDFLFPQNQFKEESKRISILVELGKLAEMRQEWDTSIQAYEEALSLLVDDEEKKRQLPIHLSLSTLFYKKKNLDLALYHAEEALLLAQTYGYSTLLSQAYLHLALLLFSSKKEESLDYLKKGISFLQQAESQEEKVLALLLASALAFHQGDKHQALKRMEGFLATGKRHFVPKLFLAYQDLVFPVFLLALEEKVEIENALWLLEEIAPFLQEKLKESAQWTPSLQTQLAPFLSTSTMGGNAVLKIQAFGKLLFSLEGKPLDDNCWRSLKGRTLLLYLFYQYPKLISEENLLDLFWPNLDPQKAKHTLRTTLYFIRRALQSREKDFIYMEKQKFGIKAEASFWCDFIQFRTMFEQAQNLWEKGEKDRSALLIKEAEKLYKGPFLQGWSDGWVLEARDFYEDAFCWMMLALSTYLAKQKAWKDALFYAKKVLDVDPTLEEAHYLMMEAYLETGKKEEAVKQFLACKEALKRELDIEPSERTYLLYLKALDKKISV